MGKRKHFVYDAESLVGLIRL